MANATTIQTALCLIPPENVWEQIQAIRSLYDRAYPRWMPHINFIYPFLPEEKFDNIKTHLEPFLARVKPFEIQFDESSFQYFSQGDDRCTYHLRPNNTTDVIELQKLIQDQLKNFIKKKKPFEAHLTLGQTTKSNISDTLMKMKAQWKTIEFTVDRVYMISRENHPEDLFVIKQEILLLGQEDKSIPHAISNLTISPMKLNHLCILLPNEFFSRVIHILENTSFQPLKPFQIILHDYESGPVNADLRSKLESISKFTLDFGPNSIEFNRTTAQLVLKPINIEPIHQLNILDDNKYDGSLILGKIDENEADQVKERLVKNFISDIKTFQIDRLHLLDSDERPKFIFRLKN